MGKGSVKQRLTGQLPRRKPGDAKRSMAAAYPFKCCAWCGMQSAAVLEIAHLDQNALNNTPDNLAWMCANDHKSFDRELLDMAALKIQRARWQITKGIPSHKLRMKDAGAKAVATRRRNIAAGYGQQPAAG